jgi:hypothetical protein
MREAKLQMMRIQSKESYFRSLTMKAPLNVKNLTITFILRQMMPTLHSIIVRVKRKEVKVLDVRVIRKVVRIRKTNTAAHLVTLATIVEHSIVKITNPIGRVTMVVVIEIRVGDIKLVSTLYRLIILTINHS